MTGKLKLAAGIFLIVLAAAAMVFWETSGRALVMNDDVVVTARQIEAGEVLKTEDLRVASVPRENLMEDCITPANIGDYIGQTLKYGLNSNSQIAVNSFISGEKQISENMSIFRINASWIKNLSSSVRSGDRVRIYAYAAGTSAANLGSYYVAFVKDGAGREVVEASGFSQPEILKRTTGVYVPETIEIAATLSDYTQLVSSIERGCSLIIMQEGVSALEH